MSSDQTANQNFTAMKNVSVANRVTVDASSTPVFTPSPVEYVSLDALGSAVNRLTADQTSANVFVTGNTANVTLPYNAPIGTYYDITCAGSATLALAATGTYNAIVPVVNKVQGSIMTGYALAATGSVSVTRPQSIRVVNTTCTGWYVSNLLE